MTALAVALLAAAECAVFVAVERALARDVDQALRAIAEAEIASAFDEPGVGAHVHDGLLASGELAEDGRARLAMLVDAHGHVLAETAALEGGPSIVVDAAVLARALAGLTTYAETRRGAEPYRVVYQSFRDPEGATLVAIVALPLSAARKTLRTLATVLAAVLGAGGVAAALGASRIARHLTRPLEQIAESATRIDTALDPQPIPDVSPDAEIRALVRILNEMLARVSAAASAQQRFVADASHELRSPLNNLLGTIEVALRRPRTAEEYRDTLTTIVMEIRRLVRLSNGLLTLSRADSGHIDRAVGCCDLNQVLEAACAAHQPRAEAGGMSVRFEPAATGLVEGDADLLREVADNLIDNALRHSPEGGEVRVEARDDEGYVSFSVTDRGPGIPAEHQTRIFERFHRVAAARDRRSGGFGLGLAIARAIVEAHRGEITVESIPGGGARFSVRLPRARAEDEESA